MPHYLYNHFHIFIPLYENTNYQTVIDKFNKQYYSNYSIYFISSENITINHPYMRIVTIDQNVNHTILQTCKSLPINDLIVILEDVDKSLNEMWLHKMNQYVLHNKPMLLFDKNKTHYWIVKAGIFIHILNHGNEKDDLKQPCFDLIHENIHNYDMNNDIFEKVEAKSSVKTEFPPLKNEIHLLLATYKRNKNVPLVLNMLKTQTVKNIHLHLLDNNEDTNTQKELDSLLDPFYKQLTISLHRYNKNLHCFGRISVVKEIIQHHMMDYIVIFDDDQIYRETWLENMIYNVKPLSTLSWYGKIFKVCDYWKSTLWYNEIEKMVRPEVKEWSYFGPGGSMIDIQLFSFEELYQYEKYSQDIRAIDDIWMSFVFKKYLNITFHRNITHPKCCIDANKLQKMTWANIKDKKSVLFKTLSKKYEWDVTNTTHNYYNINSFFDKIYVFCNDFTNLEKFRKHHICFQWVPYDNYEKNVKELLDQYVNQNICIFHENIQFREFYFYDCQKMVEKLQYGNQKGSFNISMELTEQITYHPSFGIYRIKNSSEEKNNDNIYMKSNFTSTTESSNKCILCVCPIMNQSCGKIIEYMMSQKNKNWGLLLINNNSNQNIKNEFATMKQKYVSNQNIIFVENTQTLSKADCLNSGLNFFHNNKKFTHFTWMSDCDEYYCGFVNNILKSFSNNVEFVYTNFYERFPGKKWADINGSSYKDANDLLVNYKNNIACSAWSRKAIEHIGKFDSDKQGCEGFDYVYRTFTLLNPKQIVFEKGVTMTCRCKTHSQFSREIDHVQKYIHNKKEYLARHVLMCSHSNLAHTAGDTIMWSNWANNFMKTGKHVTFISKYPIPQVFLNNLQSKNYNIIVKKNDSEIVAEMDKLESKQGSIFIRNHEILDMLKNKHYLPTITFYGLDVHINGLSKMDNKFQKIITQSEQLKEKFVHAGIIESKIEITEPLVFKYNFKLPERKDNEIRLIYCGTLRDEENILEIIEEFQKIHKERPEVVLTIVYGKINGNAEFTQKVNHYIKQGVKGITFKHNLSHRDSCYEIATSDIGICWRKNGWGDNGEVSTKVKEYELYGLLYYDKQIFTLLAKRILYIVSSDKKSSGYIQRTLHILNNRQDLLGCFNPFIIKTEKSEIKNIDELLFIHYTQNKLLQFVNKLRINTIILPSNHTNFNTIYNYLSNQTINKIKYIYELRGLWFLTTQSRHECKIGHKTSYTPFVIGEMKNERTAINNADGLIFINNTIRNYLLSELKFYEIYTKPYILLENSYTLDINIPKNKQPNKIYKIGYYGTISHYEGIDLLADACERINKKDNNNIQLLLCGANNINFDYKKYNFIEYSEFIPYTQYIQKIQELDLLCIPRRNYKVCELVPALKPLTAMYYKIPILISDFPCYREMCGDGMYYFEPDNIHSLIENIENIMNITDHSNKVNINHNLVVKKYNWKKQCENITNILRYNTCFIYNFKPNLEIWSGAVINSINEMICLSKFSNVFYNNVFLNDIIINNNLNIDLLNQQINRTFESKYIKLKKINNRLFPVILNNKFNFIFYRGGTDVTCNNEFINLPNIKIYQHTYVKDIWENNIIGFQTETANNYAKQDLLKTKFHDGTLNYHNIDNIPNKTFVRYQCIVNDVSYKKPLIIKHNEFFTIGIIGTFYTGTNPILFLNKIEELIKQSYKIKVIIYSNSICPTIDIPEYSFISFDKFNASNKMEKLTRLDLVINTWLYEQQDYGGSNKNLDAICYNIPLIVKEFNSCKEQLGNEYKLWFNNLEEINDLIKKCYEDIEFYNYIIKYMQKIKETLIVDVITNKWKLQLDKL